MSGAKRWNLEIAHRGRSKTIRFSMPQGSCLVAGLLLGCHCLGVAQAQTVPLGNFTVTLQSTLDYTLGVRTAPVDNAIATLNSDDGDRNFRTGVMANRLQALEQLNIQDGDYGLRASAFAWLDPVYLRHSENNSPDTFNSYNVGPRGFPSGTVANEGRRIEPLALFLYGAEDIDNGTQRLSWQLGRQTITWGETLFSFDGLAGLQAPADFYQAELLPNPEAQALFLPTGAARASYAFGNGLTLDGYWQFEYEPDILPGVGSYFSPGDYIGPGAQRLLESTIDEGAVSLYRGPDVRPANGFDQFGVSAHDQIGNFEVGAYFVRGIPKAPSLYANVDAAVAVGLAPPTVEPSGYKIGNYNLVYAQPVNAYGMSASTVFHQINLAAEISGRTNQPLLSDPATYTADTSADPASYNHPLYAEGDVIDGSVNGIYLSPPLPLLPNGAAFDAELTMNDVLSVTKNKENLVPGHTKDGGSFELVFTPNWFPMSSVEIETPIGWTTDFLGDSQFDSAESAGTSTYDIGVEAVYNSNLTVGANYQRYAGPPGRQGNLDRDFGTIYLQRTF